MITNPEIERSEEPGSLDGKSIVRLTHITDSAAGTEIHLDTLNRILLQRNQLTIYQFYMPDQYTKVEIQKIGKGTLIKIPLKFTYVDHKKENYHNKIIRLLWYRFVKHDCYNPFCRTAVDFKKTVVSLFDHQKIDVVVNHFPGGLDSLILMKEASNRDIPLCVINHFHNRWFRYPPIRKQLYYTQITAGLSDVGVPGFLKKNFVNILNGIDTDFFNPDDLPQKYFKKNILFLPARIVHNKGQHVLLAIVNQMRTLGIECTAVFAGKVYEIDYKARLDKYIEKHNLGENVLFTGLLSQESLRQWYRDSTLLVLPTTHDEGLPRVVIEAQSMKIPPVCFDAGGTSEALQSDTTGYITRKNDISKMQKYIIELLSDTKKRDNMGTSGRAFVVKKFSLTAMARRHEQLYQQLISRSNTFSMYP
jgi:glycosyltransferase involved in cell wall biosynthesis